MNAEDEKSFKIAEEVHAFIVRLESSNRQLFMGIYINICQCANMVIYINKGGGTNFIIVVCAFLYYIFHSLVISHYIIINNLNIKLNKNASN